MSATWMAIVTALAYLCALFAVAHYGDTDGRRFVVGRGRSMTYALGLAVYCTSWTFFGSVGLASSRGLDFLPIYLGPILVMGVGYPFVERLVRVAKAQNTTSIADFIASRYGKSEPVAAIVALIACVGVVPYMALQLKAISSSFAIVLASFDAGRLARGVASGGVSASVAALLAFFAIAFGTRRVDATEHQDGLMLAIGAESVVKLLSFLAVGAFVVWGMFDGLADLTRHAAENPAIARVVSSEPDLSSWIVMTLVSGFAILLLPRQFHVTVVENRDIRDVRTAAWVFPLYLALINVFVVPIAVAGLVLLPSGAVDRDLTVLALPLHGQADGMTLVALIGGLSAATAMVVVESVALAIMVSNDLVMPLLLNMRRSRASIERGDVGALILVIRRVAIVVMLMLAYSYVRLAGEAGLASIGLLSFACVAQIAPAFFGGLLWTRGTSRGAIAGLIAGFTVWAYTLLLPSLDPTSVPLGQLVANGPLGVALLRPTAMFGLEMPPLVHGVTLSLAANLVAYVAFSLTRQANPLERLQAALFVRPSAAPMAQSLRPWRASVTIGELEMTVARYIGAERARRAFESFLTSRGMTLAPGGEPDAHLLRFAEHLLASVIGAASSRLVLSLLLRRRHVSREAALKLVDEASAAIQYNRDVLQHAIDFARQGITVFDRDLRLVCWNREFRDLFDLPVEMTRVGVGVDEIIRFNAERGLYGSGSTDEFIVTRLDLLTNEPEPFRLRLHPSQRVIEVRSARIPDGGIVTTYTDVTAQVAAEETLEAANETLEQRVRERTDELMRLNAELGRAKAEADDANLSKTRFLAAASHDILQPLNAARLYASSLTERMAADAETPPPVDLARNVDASLEAVEEILTALLDISRLDAGAMKCEITAFRISDILNQLKLEFGPLAREKNLRLIFVPTTLSVASDRRLLRRLLQNLVSNAIKYTPKGRVLVGVRRRAGVARIEVWDTGLGIPEEKQRVVFHEFERLEAGARTARGLGLGLSIVDRIARVLGRKIELRSRPGSGSAFAIDIPLALRLPAAAGATEASAPAPRQPLAGLTVLCIDNEPRILDGMRTLLSGWGCRFVGGVDENEACGQLGPGQRPDVVIADYHLDDGYDGVTAIAILRARFDPELPAVLATADRGEAMLERAAAARITVLAKPLKPAALRALLSRWSARREVVE